MSELQITQGGLNWVLSSCQPIVSYDFMGYMFNFFHKKKRYIVSLSKRGYISVNSADGKTTGREKAEVFNRLIRNGTVEFNIEPFPEFSASHNIPFDYKKAYCVRGFLFRRAD